MCTNAGSLRARVLFCYVPSQHLVAFLNGKICQLLFISSPINANLSLSALRRPLRACLLIDQIGQKEYRTLL